MFKTYDAAPGKSRRRDEAIPNEVVALQDVSFGVDAGKIVSVIGPSGCGKTTLLHIIDGLRTRDAGTILLNGRELEEPSDSLAMVFQDVRLLPWKTVWKNIEFAVAVKDHRNLTAQEKERIDRIIEAVGLAEFADAYPYQLSGGMQQRVGVARALARSPEMLLLDEPFGSLDAQTRLVMQDFFLELQGRFGLPVILVTHDIDEAVYMSSQCVVLSSRPGRVKAVVDITLPQPRRYEVRAHPDFARFRARVWDLLRPDAAVIE